ncbi:hypothetical protein [uncultured Chloroflexus sp.]|uniref:hypothetical protein n=1 Tax=uncultured Chloroflexus sp. TaxID=214040 RepID=UPI002606D8E6|nr:hypothetical protein [uncultured Chloroflexus sp.]
MPPKPSRSANLPPDRGRAPAPWTIWELMAIAVSVLMIVVPLTLEALNWLRPPIAPAQGLMAVTETAASLEQRPPTFTPVNSPTPVTVTPTVETVTPSPTPATTRVTKFASLANVAPGQTFSYSLAVTTQSAGLLTVTLRDVLDSQLELLEVSAISGTCFPGQTVLCTLTVSTLNPASVTLQVRVRPTTSIGTLIPNQAVLEQGSLTIATSNVVNVTVAGEPVPTAPAVTSTPETPTTVVTITPTPTSPTVTPITTNTPIPTQVVTPVATSRPTSPPAPRPTSPPAPRPTEPPAPTSPPAPTVPTSPSVLPTEPPPPAPVVTVAPRPPATPRPRPPASPTATSLPEITPTPTEQPAPAVFSEGDLLLRLSSDWGSAYAGQDVVFTVVLGNTHPEQTISAVNLRSVLPSNLQVLSANASRGADPVISSQTVTYTAPDLAPGERVQITIATRIRPNVTAGTLLVVQAQASYSGLSRPVFSNISTVLVVGEQQVVTATATLAPVTSPTATATVGVTATAIATAASSSPTATAGAVIGGGTSPTATVTPTPPAAGGQSGGQAPLPNTSAGIPFLGVLLLGATLLTRTVRLHRARERI